MWVPVRGGFEQDVFSSARRVLCYTQRPGVCRKAKKAYSKRLRKFFKRGVDTEDWGV